MAEELDTAEALLNASQYEEAYTLLDSIDGSKYAQRSRMQARYALLYTRALYKNYIVSPSDSLISIAVDYAEEHGDDEDKFYAYLYQGIVRYELGDYPGSTFSLIRALANADDVTDAYSKGQMYTLLALINEEQKCSDEEFYAHMAYKEYENGGLKNYYANALGRIAVAKLHREDYDSCRILLDKAIVDAASSENHFTLTELLSAKAQYAVLLDSIDLAENIYNELIEDFNYPMSLMNLGDIAFIQAIHHNNDSAISLLSQAEAMCLNMSDRYVFLTKSLWCYEKIDNSQKVSDIKDSLLLYAEKRINGLVAHSSLAEQKDYSEWQTMVAKNKSLQKSRIIVLLSLSLLILLLLFFLYYREKKNQLIIQIEKVERLQAQLAIQSKENVAKLLLIKSSSVVNELKEKARGKSLPHIDWETLDKLFSENIPYFEQSLKELTSLSEIEWRVCMLIKLDFAPGDIAVLLNRTAGAISVIRSRLYNKVFRTKGRPRDWDTFIEKL